MSDIHRSYGDEVKNNQDYDVDGYNNYLDCQYEQYPYGKKDEEE